MKITLGNTLPPYPDFVEGIRRTHDRGYTLVFHDLPLTISYDFL